MMRFISSHLQISDRETHQANTFSSDRRTSKEKDRQRVQSCNYNYHQRSRERSPQDLAVHDSMKQRATRVREAINTGLIDITHTTPLLGEDEDDELLMEAVDRGCDNETFYGQ